MPILEDGGVYVELDDQRPKTELNFTKIDKNYFRPCEVNSLIGDSTKAFKDMKWSAKISLEDLVSDMIKHDNELAKKDTKIK